MVLDARLFLEGTRGVTQVALLANLVEAKPPSSEAMRKNQWPTAASPETTATPGATTTHPPPARPFHKLTLDTSYDDMLYALRDWYFNMDTLGLLSPVLVGALDGSLHVYRRQGADGVVTLAGITPFLKSDMPIPNATITLTLSDVYGPDHALVQAATPQKQQEEEGIVINITRMAEYITRTRVEMRRRRAFDRARLVLKHHQATSPQPPAGSMTTTTTNPTAPERPVLVDITQNVQDNDAAPQEDGVLPRRELRKRPLPSPRMYGQSQGDSTCETQKWRSVKREKRENDELLQEQAGL